jgi:hypothetical protein
MTLAAFLSFIQANSTTLLGLWVIFEQYLAQNRKIKANSTFQLVNNLIRALLTKKP